MRNAPCATAVAGPGKPGIAVCAAEPQVAARGPSTSLLAVAQHAAPTIFWVLTWWQMPLAAQLGCEGDAFHLARGEASTVGRSEEPRITLAWACLNTAYGSTRSRLGNLTQSVAGIAEKVLKVRVQRIVWWYSLATDDLLPMSRSICPQERMVSLNLTPLSPPRHG